MKIRIMSGPLAGYECAVLEVLCNGNVYKIFCDGEYKCINRNDCMCIY